MIFCTTRNHQYRAGLKEAVLQGLAPDGGLFMPVTIPVLPKEFLAGLRNQSLQDIGRAVAGALIGDAFPQNTLNKIVEDALNFDVPLVDIEENIFALELYHGPTLAFKDFGARFMARLVAHYAEGQNSEITILVATSGDTGGAVASGFSGVPGVRVVVLYPSGMVSPIQEKQITTLGKNIVALKVQGNFDDCQKLVKIAFADEGLRKEMQITSANSINIARLIPQTFYYFHAVAQWRGEGDMIFSVPSGNFGNLTAGVIAARMGLPVKQFVAATNVNDVVPEYLEKGILRARPSVQTISNAMDVGNPSNFERMRTLYADDLVQMRAEIKGYAFTDESTRGAMKDVFKSSGYVLDPHGAVAYLGARSYLNENRGGTAVILETAHPAKFNEIVEETLRASIAFPESLVALNARSVRSIGIRADYEELKQLLLS